MFGNFTATQYYLLKSVALNPFGDYQMPNIMLNNTH
jgi:hypothetical protein